VLFALLPVWRAWLLTPAEVVVNGTEYRDEAVLVRVYADVAARRATGC